MAKLYRLILLVTLCLIVSGCGFHLRGSEPLPDTVDYVQVVSAQAHAPLTRALIQRLDVYDITGGHAPREGQAERSVVIRLAPEQLERRLLSVFSTGQVAEYELIYGVNYTVTFPGREAIPAYFEVLRDYQDDPDQVLAKSRELELVLAEMRQEAADRIIRRLSSQATVLPQE